MSADDFSHWYERYFGPDYLRIYRLADTADQLDFLRRVLLPWPPGARLLDLPCGHGRHAVALADWGVHVTGLDLSPTFLALARRAAADRGVPLRLLRGDMRAFPFGAASFDVAICMFTSLGYFETVAENQLVLDEFGRVVRPGGRFVLDLANIDHVRHQPDHSHWEKDGASVTTRYLWDEPRHRAITLRQVTFDEGRQEHYESSVRLFEADELLGMVDRAGFAVEETLGAYPGGEVTPETPRRILLCRRR